MLLLPNTKLAQCLRKKLLGHSIAYYTIFSACMLDKIITHGLTLSNEGGNLLVYQA